MIWFLLLLRQMNRRATTTIPANVNVHMCEHKIDCAMVVVVDFEFIKACVHDGMYVYGRAQKC